MCHGGPLIPVSLGKVTLLSGPLFAVSRILPHLSLYLTNEMIGGDDIHQSLSLPLFISLIYVHAVTAPWVCVVRAEGLAAKGCSHYMVGGRGFMEIFRG